MSIEITYKNGKIDIVNSLYRRYEPVILSEDEEAADKVITSIIDKSSLKRSEWHAERRTKSYLSYVLFEEDDFLRIKVSQRTKWFSVAVWGIDKEMLEDARLSDVKNKNQRHWKIPLKEINDLREYEDIILSSIRISVQNRNTLAE